MRIIGGQFKGRRFSPPGSFKARPTTDFAKENLFNVLENRYDLSDLKILDLFSGTGSISYEFASRGCSDVTSIEISFNHFRFIQKCIAELGLKQNIRSFKYDSFRYIEKCTEQFDLVFADPPFDLQEGVTLPDKIFSKDILKPDGIFILEHSDKISFQDHPNFREVRDYGKVNFSFFGRK